VSDPGTCPACKGPMKPLFTGFFCPKDCDRPKAFVEPKAPATPGTITYASIKKKANSYGGWGGLAAWLPATPPQPDDECRDLMCRAKGRKTHAVGMGNPMAWHDSYQCTTCSKTWTVPSAPQGATIP
jgi:hypothetical protein